MTRSVKDFTIGLYLQIPHPAVPQREEAKPGPADNDYRPEWWE